MGLGSPGRWHDETGGKVELNPAASSGGIHQGCYNDAFNSTEQHEIRLVFPELIEDATFMLLPRVVDVLLPPCEIRARACPTKMSRSAGSCCLAPKCALCNTARTTQRPTSLPTRHPCHQLAEGLSLRK